MLSLSNIIKNTKNNKRFNDDYTSYVKLNHGNPKFQIEKEFIIPCYDWECEAGDLDPHYFLQDIYIASHILKKNPSCHYDIGSRVDGFIAHLLASMMKVVLIDIRPLSVEIPGLYFQQGDAVSLSNIQDNTIESLSSLHAVEHFGLGRYGDSIDPDAWKKAIHEMARVLKPGGTLYLSVPIGDKERLYFNAHRVFDPQTITDELSPLKLEKFAYIKDMKIFESDVGSSQDAYGTYGCGMFIFRK